tara:strand:- start:2497 stop:2730 length:234 start_codon:yes stop_codon:yes gene_type:complete
MAKSKAYHNGEHSASPIIAEFDVIQTGLTKREAFAMAAMQGILANSEPNSWSEEQWYSNFSKQAVNHADALLKELAK